MKRNVKQWQFDGIAEDLNNAEAASDRGNFGLAYDYLTMVAARLRAMGESPTKANKVARRLSKLERHGRP